MADRDRPLPPQPHLQQPGYDGGSRSRKAPSTGQILIIIALLPVCATLLGMAGITLAGSLIGLAVAAPLFVIFSPVLVPAAVLMAGTVTAFITSGAFGLTGFTSISWVLNSFRKREHHPLEEAGIYVGEKTKQMAETIRAKAQEGGGART